MSIKFYSTTKKIQKFKKYHVKQKFLVIPRLVSPTRSRRPRLGTAVMQNSPRAKATVCTSTPKEHVVVGHNVHSSMWPSLASPEALLRAMRNRANPKDPHQSPTKEVVEKDPNQDLSVPMVGHRPPHQIVIKVAVVKDNRKAKEINPK